MRLGDVVSVVRGKHKGERGYIVALSQEGRTLEQLKEFDVYRRPTSQEAVLTNFDRTRCFIVRLNTLKHRQAICTQHKNTMSNDPVNSNSSSITTAEVKNTTATTVAVGGITMSSVIFDDYKDITLRHSEYYVLKIARELNYTIEDVRSQVNRWFTSRYFDVNLSTEEAIFFLRIFKADDIRFILTFNKENNYERNTI